MKQIFNMPLANMIREEEVQPTSDLDVGKSVYDFDGKMDIAIDNIVDKLTKTKSMNKPNVSK